MPRSDFPSNSIPIRVSDVLWRSVNRLFDIGSLVPTLLTGGLVCCEDTAGLASVSWSWSGSDFVLSKLLIFKSLGGSSFGTFVDTLLVTLLPCFARGAEAFLGETLSWFFSLGEEFFALTAPWRWNVLQSLEVTADLERLWVPDGLAGALVAGWECFRVEGSKLVGLTALLLSADSNLCRTSLTETPPCLIVTLGFRSWLGFFFGEEAGWSSPTTDLLRLPGALVCSPTLFLGPVPAETFPSLGLQLEERADTEQTADDRLRGFLVTGGGTLEGLVVDLFATPVLETEVELSAGLEKSASADLGCHALELVFWSYSTGERISSLVVGVAGECEHIFSLVVGVAGECEHIFSLVVGVAGEGERIFSLVVGVAGEGERIFSLVVGVAGEGERIFSLLVGVKGEGEHIFPLIVGVAGEGERIFSLVVGVAGGERIFSLVMGVAKEDERIFPLVVGVAGEVTVESVA